MEISVCVCVCVYVCVCVCVWDGARICHVFRYLYDSIPFYYIRIWEKEKARWKTCIIIHK